MIVHWGGYRCQGEHWLDPSLCIACGEKNASGRPMVALFMGSSEFRLFELIPVLSSNNHTHDRYYSKNYLIIDF
jgi:hypothetical protein